MRLKKTMVLVNEEGVLSLWRMELHIACLYFSFWMLLSFHRLLPLPSYPKYYHYAGKILPPNKCSQVNSAGYFCIIFKLAPRNRF